MATEPLSEKEIEALRNSVNHVPKNLRSLAPTEVAGLFEKGINNGMAMGELGEAIDLSPSMIQRFRNLLKLPEEIMPLVDWGHSHDYGISFTTAAYELSKVRKAEIPLLAKEIMVYGLSKTEVRAVRQLRERSGEDLDDCIKRVIRRRSRPQIRAVVMGRITSKDTQNRLFTLSQKERDAKLKNVVARTFGDVGDYDARLGRSTFTIIGSNRLSRAIKRQGNFEETINNALKDELSVRPF